MVRRFEEVTVECYSGYRVSEAPRAFTYRGEKHQVAEVVDRWYEEGLRAPTPRLDYYKVRTEEGGEYLLRYNALFNAWAILVDEG